MSRRKPFCAPFAPWQASTASGRCVLGSWGSPPIAVAPPSRAARRPVVLETLDDHADPRRAFADPDDLAAELEIALKRLRPEYRAVFVLYHEHHLPYEEISAALDRPVGTVKTWLHRAAPNSRRDWNEEE